MKNFRESKLQIARHLIQLISLIFAPGIFIITYGNTKRLYISIITDSFSFQTMLPSIINLVIVIGLTIILGRFFCGWFCAFGSFMDIIYFISKKILRFEFKVSENLDKYLKYIKYIIFILSVVFIWSFKSNFLDNKNPWDAFAKFPNFYSMIFEHTISFVILIFIVFGAMFIERFFCRYLCPLGAVFSAVSKFRIIKIGKKKDKCGKCRICTSKCIMGISMYKHNRINSGECIDCLKCTEVCPRKNIKVKATKETITPFVASAIAVGSFVALQECGNYIDNKVNPPVKFVVNENNNELSSINYKGSNSNGIVNDTSSALDNDNYTEDSNIDNGLKENNDLIYKDGVYTGVGTGFNPGNILSVTIKNGKIVNIQVVSTNDTPRFFQIAYNQVSEEILSSQSTDVDAVSGATMSSDGIIQAVKNALDKAK